jgi:chemotaxis protein CheD
VSAARFVDPGRLPSADGPAEVFLQPGQLLVSVEPTSISTILGSCVSVCLWDRVRRIGGMNHYVLPRGPRLDQSDRFGENALPHLLQRLIDSGARLRGLEAKVFGGARVLTLPGLTRDLGHENVEHALEFLAAQSIPVVARNTGGARGRRLTFQTADAVVWLKTL